MHNAQCTITPRQISSKLNSALAYRKNYHKWINRQNEVGGIECRTG